LASVTVDLRAFILGKLSPFGSVTDRLANAFRRHLFGDTTLQDLPDMPNFIVTAANLGSGALMRFSKPYLADYRVGRVENPSLSLATAVTASCANPPLLSPCTIDLAHEAWISADYLGNDLTDPAYRGRIRLTNGGVYDTLAVETAWKRCRTILVSDGAGYETPNIDPPNSRARHTARVVELISTQVRELRKRQVIEALRSGVRQWMYVCIRDDPGLRSAVRQGMYVEIRDDPGYDDPGYGPAEIIPASQQVTRTLAATPARLSALDYERQQLLINWGYAICDTGLRAHIDHAEGVGNLPYPNSLLTEVSLKD
jgi:NTE family protein